MSKELQIIYLNDNERTEHEARDKGYRRDVYVKCDGSVFHLYVYDSVRLIQDFEMEQNENGFYAIDPNLVLVDEVTKEKISFVVAKLYAGKFFDELKPVEGNVLLNLNW